MQSRALSSIAALALAIATVTLTTSRVVGQAPSATTRTAGVKSSTLRTPWGHPDLQGTWIYSDGTTPLERPTAFAGRPFLTDVELAQAEQQVRERNSRDRRDGVGTDADVSRDYNEFWDEGGKSATIRNRRTSLIADPPDGRLPPLTADAQRREAARAAATRGRGPSDSWEDRSLQERCITFRDYGPPLLAMTNNEKLLGRDRIIQILQTPQDVAILHDYIQGPRIISLDGRPHLSPEVHQWQGDSRGHWDGNTLVVDTTNFVDEEGFVAAETGVYRSLKASYEQLHLVERFTRVNAATINYEFTVDAPATFTRPWTVAFPLERTRQAIFETSCHEGNYSLPDILGGARVQEKVAAQTAKRGSQ